MINYSPEKMGDVAGHRMHKDLFQRAIERGYLNNHILLKGPHGIGKSSIARIVSRELLWDTRMDLKIINCQDEKPSDIYESIKYFTKTATIGSEHKIVIFEEIDELRKDFQVKIEPYLDDTSDKGDRNTVFIATTNCIENGSSDISSKLWDIFDHREFGILEESEIREYAERINREYEIGLSGELIDKVVEKAEGKPRRVNQILGRYE